MGNRIPENLDNLSNDQLKQLVLLTSRTISEFADYMRVVEVTAGDNPLIQLANLTMQQVIVNDTIEALDLVFGEGNEGAAEGRALVAQLNQAVADLTGASLEQVGEIARNAGLDA